MEQEKLYPKLSESISLDSIPESLSFVKEVISDILDGVYIKEHVVLSSHLITTVRHEMVLLIDRSFAITIPGLNISLILNPSFENKENTEIPVGCSINLPIKRYINNFSSASFGSVGDYFELFQDVLDMSDVDIVYHLLEEQNVDASNFYADIINRFDTISFPIIENFSDNLYVALEQIEDVIDTIDDIEDSLLEIAIKIYCLNFSYSQIKNLLRTLFKTILDEDPIAYIQKLITPIIDLSIGISAALEIPNSILKPISKDDVVSDENLRLLIDAGNVYFHSQYGFNFDSSISLSMPNNYSKAQIGNTSMTLSFRNAKLSLSRENPIEEVLEAGYPSDFVGVYVGEAEVGLPDTWKVNDDSSSAKIVGRDILIGTGGFSGTIGMEPKDGEETPLLSCTFGKWEVSLEDFSIRFQQNSIVESSINGYLILPEKLRGNSDGKVEITISIDNTGDFSIAAKNKSGLVIPFMNGHELFTITVKSLAVGKTDGDFYLETSGKLSFQEENVKKLLSGDLEIESLRIWSDGRTEISGGTIPLKDSIELQLGPARINVTSICHGSTEKKKGGEIVSYKYWGFDGGININPGGVDARGSGIKFCYSSDFNDWYISIESFGVDIIIPGNAKPEQGTAIIKGWLSVCEENLPLDGGGTAEAKTYGGSISLTLPKFHLDASVGMKYSPDIPAWIVDAGVSLSNPLLLGSTGLGIYGFNGILGRRYVVSKSAAGLTDESTWYDYYQASPRGIRLEKFAYPSATSDSDKAFSAGAGILLATVNDAGRMFSSKLMLLLSLPNVFIMEGKARVLGDRVGFNDVNEPPFYAFVSISDESVESGFGAHLQVPEDKGGILKIDGDAELAYYFSNPKSWKINIGSKESPVQARLFNLFRSEAYLMLSARGMETEASALLQFNKEYLKGTLRAYVDAYMKVGGRISFDRPQIATSGSVGGNCGVKIFGKGLDLGFVTTLSIEAPKPLLIEGAIGLSFGIKILKKPIKKSFTIEFKWKTNEVQEVETVELLNPSSGAVAHNIMSDELFEVCCVKDGGALNYPMIPLDSYIDIRFTKPLYGGSSVGKLGGSSVFDGYMETIPPKPHRRYVKHTYTLNNIKILASSHNRDQWLEYFPYKSASDGTVSGVSEQIGNWQLSQEGRYDTIRLLSQSPFSYMDKGMKEWCRLEQYGISGGSLYCTGTSSYWSTADFSGISNGTNLIRGVLNSRSIEGESVAYSLSQKCSVIANPNSYYVTSNCLELNGTVLLKCSEPVKRMKLHISSADMVTFMFGKTSYDEQGRSTVSWLHTESRQGGDLLEPVDFESEESYDCIKILASQNARNEIKREIQLLKECLYEGTYTQSREELVSQIESLATQYRSLSQIDSRSLSSEQESVQRRLTDVSEQKTMILSSLSEISMLLEQAETLIGNCCLESPSQEVSAEDECISRLESIANTETQDEALQAEINTYKQKLQQLQVSKESAKREYADNFQQLRSSGTSYLRQLNEKKKKLQDSLSSIQAEESELLQRAEALSSLSASIQNVGSLNVGDRVRLYQIEWLSERNYEIEQRNPSRSEIEAAYRAKVDAIEHQIQPIWRPYTDYQVVVDVCDSIETQSQKGLNHNQTYRICFQTGGPVGYFHEDHDAVSEVKYIQEEEYDANVLQRYPLASLKSYIDYDRSYPNADGNLLNAKPLYYECSELKLRYKYGYVENLFRDWSEYDAKQRKLLPSQYGRLSVVVKDPMDNGAGRGMATEIVESKYIPSSVVEWSSDESAKVPNGIKVEDILRNPSAYNSEYASTNWVCWEESDKKIKPGHMETNVRIDGLRPNTLYTALFFNEYGSTKGTMESREVHRYVFQTSRYASFEKQIKSYQRTAGNGEVFDAVYDFPHVISREELQKIRNIMTDKKSGESALDTLYVDPFDQMTEGVMGLPPQEKADDMEIARVRDASGNLIGILLRSPEPLMDPKIPDGERKGFCTLVVQKKSGLQKFTKNYLFSKDCSQLFITTDSFKIDGKSFRLEFKELEWTGEKYETKEDVVETKEIPL